MSINIVHPSHISPNLINEMKREVEAYLPILELYGASLRSRRFNDPEQKQHSHEVKFTALNSYAIDRIDPKAIVMCFKDERSARYFCNVEGDVSSELESMLFENVKISNDLSIVEARPSGLFSSLLKVLAMRLGAKVPKSQQFRERISHLKVNSKWDN